MRRVTGHAVRAIRGETSSYRDLVGVFGHFGSGEGYFGIPFGAFDQMGVCHAGDVWRKKQGCRWVLFAARGGVSVTRGPVGGGSFGRWPSPS